MNLISDRSHCRVFERQENGYENEGTAEVGTRTSATLQDGLTEPLLEILGDKKTQADKKKNTNPEYQRIHGFTLLIAPPKSKIPHPLMSIPTYHRNKTIN